MTKDLIERLRLAIDEGWQQTFILSRDDMQLVLDSLQSGETGLVGWVMVPREPTSTMTHAALDASRQSDTRLLPDCKEIWASEQVYRAMLSAAPPSPDPEQAPTRPSVEGDYRGNLARALFEAANGKNLIAWSDATRDFWLSRADQALAIPKASASDGSGDLVDPLEKLRALRRLCDASSQPFYVEIIDEILAALSPTIAPPDPVARQMAEALRNMIALAEPHFTSAAETLALNESVNALNFFDGRAGR